LFQDILHARIPKGPAGQYALPGPFTDMLMKYSPNQKSAKDFLKWVHSKPVFSQWFTSQQGYTDGATKDWEKDPVWDLDPILLPFRDLPTIGRTWGFAGPPGRASAEAVTKYVIVDMYAKAIQGMAPEDAVKWAHDELVKIYT
jgi:multiple sugar transport system substrate-binding protein